MPGVLSSRIRVYTRRATPRQNNTFVTSGRSAESGDEYSNDRHRSRRRRRDSVTVRHNSCAGREHVHPLPIAFYGAR